MSGVMTLYDFDGSVVMQRLYDSKKKRASVLLEWSKLFGSLYNRMHIHYKPFARVDLVHKDGTNSLRPNKREPKPAKIVRPPAVYDNIKNYNY
jgi:hypothetical protein